MLVVTLGACFWFNTIFGFNIFSGAHWEQIATLQAAQTPVKPEFYISMFVVIFAVIMGLYLIIRPRMRKIRLPIVKTAPIHTSTKSPQQTPVQQNNPDASTLDILPTEIQPATFHQDKPVSSPSASSRPPRLNIPVPNNFVRPQTQQNTPPSVKSAPATQTPQIAPELREIFTSAGYTVKPAPRVNGIQIALAAIGTNEVMWIGCVGVKTTDVRNIINAFEQIFTDTLEETSIEINGFAIAAPDAATSEFQDILMFNTPDELRQYIQQNPNPPLPADDDGMFDAYSEYIDAVINHIGKL